MADTPQLDAAAIKSLVEEVVRRIQAGAASGIEFSTRATGSSPLPLGEGGRRPGEGASATSAESVITLAHIERLAPGTREIAVSARAVITPSARDRAREVGIAIVRAAAGAASAQPAARPFVIGQADCRGDAAGRAAAIARVIPQSQRLPATGLADVIAALALHASRDAARGVLLTSRPAVALVLANRSPNLRAVTGRDVASVSAAAGDCDANLLVMDPAAFTGSLERASADFAARPAGPLPAELTQAPAGCACKSHPH